MAQWLEHLTRHGGLWARIPSGAWIFSKFLFDANNVSCSTFTKNSLATFFFVQGEEHYQIKCCRCNSVLGSGSTEEKNHSSLHMELRDFNSINLHKHSISLRHSHLFRYSMLNVI